MEPLLWVFGVLGGYVLGIRLWSKFRCWMVSVRRISPERARNSLKAYSLPWEEHWFICAWWPVALLAFLVAAAIRYDMDGPANHGEFVRAIEAGENYIAPAPRRGEGGGVEQLPLPSRKGGG